MKTKQINKLKLYLIILCTTIVFPGFAQHNAEWMRERRFGVMFHYLSDWIARTENLQMSVEKWNSLINGFNVEKLADQVESVGAGYCIFTIGQNSGYYVAPNATYDKLVGIRPSKCSNSDLISDLADALESKDIKLIVYLPSGAPSGDQVARNALEWQNGPFPNVEFQKKWEAIIRDWSLRWGNKIAGWWFDGAYWPNTMYRSKTPPNFESFAAAAKAGNKESIVAFNPGVVPRTISITPYEDYIAGEISNPDIMSIMRVYDGLVDGSQLQILSYLGERWGMGNPRFEIKQIIEWSQQVWENQGAITWDLPLQSDGTIKTDFLEQLKAVRIASEK
jgi:hypothetical protein